ncbi:MAG TPA: autotransporter outer membrane beta-barrel domain-containing protein, partial [Pedomonas sp.]|uniref:autotransporter outer membrane beta-barrel domain-containing protein n=1 Tax=Pedomonas sp. TaxID=2976421 RepID=UPI002F40DCCC
SVSAGLLNDSRHIRDAVLANVVLDGQGTGLWGQVLGSWGAADAHEGMARLSTDHQGVIVGVSRSGNGFAVGFAAGLSNADYRAGARASSADVSSQFLAVHGGLASGALSLQIGGAYAWHDVDASRSIVFPGYSGSVTAEYDASTRQLFGELAYGIPAGGLTLSPFARLAHTRTRTDGFAERGASEAALNVASQTRTLDLLSLGLKLDGSLEISSSARLAPAISVAWQRAWGDRMDAQDVRFTDGTAGFAIQGQQVQRTSAVVDAGVALDLGAYTIGAAYRGAVADRWADHGAKLTLGLRF